MIRGGKRVDARLTSLPISSAIPRAITLKKLSLVACADLLYAHVANLLTEVAFVLFGERLNLLPQRRRKTDIDRNA